MQTFTQLESELLAEGVRPSAFRINNTPTDGAYCIQFDGQTTEVFTPERGIKFDLAVFEDQEQGMTEFKNRVLADQTTRSDWDGTVT